MANGKRETPRSRLSLRKKLLIVLAAELLCLIGSYFFLVYTSNPFISEWRTIYIETAMTTQNHKWLATALLPHGVVQPVVDHMNELNAKQADLYSTWDLEEDLADLPEAPKKDPEALAAPTEDQEAAAEATPAEEQPSAEPEPDPVAVSRENFYAAYPELDPAVFDACLAAHPEMTPTGLYDDLFLEDLDGTLGLKTVYDETVLVLDVPNNLLLLELNTDNYVAKLAIVKDPRQVYLEPASNLGHSEFGDTIETYGQNYNALIAINAAGFYDPDGEGWGGYIVGSYVAHGADYTISVMPGYKTFGFKKDHRLYIEGESFDKSEYLWAMQFSPALIVDGELTVEGSNGYGLQPRSTIGQTADGTFLLLTVDGRQVGYSIGATVTDCAEILLRHGAYQAMNLDGGSSTVMAYRGTLITKPSSVTSFGRYLPNAFVVHPASELPED